MRPLPSALVVFTLILHSPGHAQESPAASSGDRLFLSFGMGSSGWNNAFTGLRLGAEYHFTPVERVLGVRAHLATFWTPTQAFSRRAEFYEPGTTFEGFGQVTQLDVGVTASLTPWPRRRVSPYGLLGLGAAQAWTSGWGAFYEGNGNLAGAGAPNSVTSGTYSWVVGAGVRFRVGERLMQVEFRRLPTAAQSTYSFGTALRF